ncbi:Mob1/phocein, partial [Gymnopilus junonius]
MAAVIQRPLRGSRISTFYPVKNLPSLSSLDSAFQLQEYISLLIRLDVHDVEAITSLPGTSGESNKEDEKEKEGEKSKSSAPEVSVDEACWIYEQLRRLAQDLSHPLITTLQQECTRASCPEMKAGEWLYLCVAHGNDGAMEQCCAIDYILHTVDSATALLNSPRTFPSRLSIPQTSHRHFSSLARRLGRIFAHAYFHHREAFEQAEAESSLYARFLALTSKFDLVPSEFLVIPAASSSSSSFSGSAHHDHQHPHHPPPPTVTRSKFGRNRTDTMVFADAEA